MKYWHYKVMEARARLETNGQTETPRNMVAYMEFFDAPPSVIDEYLEPFSPDMLDLKLSDL